MNKFILLPLLITIICSASFYYISLTLSTVIIFIPGIVITYILYRLTIYRKIPQPERILPLYLVLLGIQFLHFTEEYLTDFHIAVPQLLGGDEYPVDVWVTFNMVAYSVFVVGGIVIFRQLKEFWIVPLFFILAGVLFNAIGHILLSIFTGGYFPGLYTALIYAILGPVMIKRILESSPRQSMQE